MFLASDAPRDERADLEPDKSYEYRSPFQRDRDRILHSSAFHRLAGVTQVVSASEDTHLLHNRLTHSIKVAQVARRLAEKLAAEQPDEAAAIGGPNPDVAEAAALAHDLGHPPFGHVGETALQDAAKKQLEDAFEGNPQSFRIVTKIAVRNTEYDGLNLTRATLNAILKYPWQRAAGDHWKKWGAFVTESREFEFARRGWPPGDDRRSVEAELMDWADDIAYSVHDVEDFYRMGLIPLDKLSREPAEREMFFKRVHERHKEKGIPQKYTPKELEDAFGETMALLPGAPYEVSRYSRAKLRSFTSEMIAQYAAAIHLQVPTNDKEKFVRIDEQALKEITMLKELTWHYVIHNPALASQQSGHRKIIETLFNDLFSAASSTKRSNLSLFPPIFREAIELETDKLKGGPEEDRNAAVARIVLDVISSMTERQALRMYGRLEGTDPGSILDPLYY